MLHPKATRNRTLLVVQFLDLERSRMDLSISELDSLIKEVKRSWHISAQDNTNPLEIALPLLDNTSVGMAYKLPDFIQLTERIARSLQVAVNEHYQAFNNSVGSYDLVYGSIKESQEAVKQVRTTLKQISSDISAKNQELSELNERCKQHGDMVEILDAVEEMKEVPSKIDALFADKKYGLIEELLARADLQATIYGLWGIPALSNIQSYLKNAQKTLVDTIVDELHATVYLKTKSLALLSAALREDSSDHADSLLNLELYISNIVNIDVAEKSLDVHNRLVTFLSQMEAHKSPQLSATNTGFDDDPYGYIAYLLEILSKLNELPRALDTLTQRHPTELHKVVLDVSDDVKARHPKLAKAEKSLVDFGMPVGDLNNIILQDFFWQVFTRFLLVLQAHRIVFEVSKRLSNLPEDQFAHSGYNFVEIWKNVSSEARSLMYSYITNDAVVFGDSTQNTKGGLHTPLTKLSEWDVNALFDKKKVSQIRLETLFEFDQSLGLLSDAHSEDLRSFLKEVFPGFKVSQGASAEHPLPYLDSEELTQQDTLVAGNVFNMRVILESFLVFVQGCKGLFPKGLDGNEPVNFMNDFMRKSFLPQLDETVEYMYEKTVNVEPFEIQSISNYKMSGGRLIQNPEGSCEGVKVFKLSIGFFNLFTRICGILNTWSRYREEYTLLVVQLLHKIYSKYEELYNTLLPNVTEIQISDKASTGSPKQLIKWLQLPELTHVLLQVLELYDRKLLLTETGMLVLSGTILMKAVDKTQILHPKNFDLLTHLVGTVDWILQWLPDMRKVTEPETPSDSVSVEYLRKTWELAEFNQTALTGLNIKITFEEKSILLGQFDGSVSNFRKLYHNSLLALRYDLRLRLIYYVLSAISNNVWNPSLDVITICEEVKELCGLILFYKNKLFVNLSEQIGEQILFGIPNMIDRLLIIGAEMIPVLNQTGVKKLYLNIITIQQSLRTMMRLPEDVDFTHSLAYFDLFKRGVEKIIEQNSHGKSLFNLQENKTMIRLIHSEKMDAGGLEANRRYVEDIRELERVRR